MLRRCRFHHTLKCEFKHHKQQMRPHSRKPSLPAELGFSSAALFSLVTTDVFNPQSFSILPQLDIHVHNWVVNNVTVQIQETLAGFWLSNAAIVLSLLVWAACFVINYCQQNYKAIVEQCILLCAFFLANPLAPQDAPLVFILKEIFQRQRPSLGHHTFSFPSGHTFAATVLVGALLFIVLEKMVPLGRQKISKRLKVIIWCLGILSTAAGRVLSDAHWISDTFAGAACGCAYLVFIQFIIFKVDAKFRQRGN